MERDSFDQQLFTWEHWADEGPLSMQYTNVELKVPVGEFSMGTKFPFAFILGDASILVLVDDAQEEHAFDLKLSVGEKVDPPVAECGPECHHDHSH